MKIILVWLGFIAFVSAATPQQCAVKKGIEILVPSNGKIYHEEYAGVTVRLNDRNITNVMIITDKNVRYPINLTKECDGVCSKTIRLHPGVNSIRIWGYKGDKIAVEESSEIYHVSKFLKGYKDPPLKFKESYFHTDENERLCGDCHDMTVNEQKGVAFLDIRDSNCYMCHKDIANEKYAHAPTVNWLCTSCHTGKTGEKNKEYAGKSNFLSPEPAIEVCYGCHDQNKAYWEPKAFKHLPVKAGSCTRCHNPHSSKNQFFLRESEQTLCLECHGDKKMSSQMRGNSKCPGAQGDGCVKCHNPHVSDHKFFLDSPRTPKPEKER